MRFKKKENRFAKIMVIVFELMAVLILGYLVVMPVYPNVKYSLTQKEAVNEPGGDVQEEFKAVKKETMEIVNRLPENEYDVSANRIIITKIGVNAPIVEAQNPDYGLSLGAWRVPESSIPPKGGNTVITGHRFKYLPPSNLTFYLFHKLEIGDIASVLWEGDYYYYRIREIKVVEPTDVSIQDQTNEPILTMYTCDPIYSQKHRLVVIGELITEAEAKK